MTALAVDPAPHLHESGVDPSDDGNVILERAGAAVLAFVFSTSAAASAARPGERRYKSHFATCPDAASFRKPKGERRVHGG